MKIRAFLILFSVSYILTSQEKSKFGELNIEERNFVRYEKDTTASAVYLFEKGENYFEVRNDYIRLITKYHAKIKILKKEGFEKSIIEIPYYHNSSATEKVDKIRALTHNGTRKQFLPKEDVFQVDQTENWSVKRFTFPEVKIGSVLEYSYEIESPFYYNLNGWEFQSDIPKVYSEYNAKIPGNWVYNRTLKGNLKLDVNDAKVAKACFLVKALGETADCEDLKYAMRDVPAFKDDEAFMLSGKNYRSSIEFELSQYHNLRGGIDKFTKTWKDVDREFKTNPDIGRQLNKKNFFEKNVPDSLFASADALQKAKNIYKFVQNHYLWNRKYGLWNNNRVKKAFDEKSGNVAEINITLINLLNTAGFKTDLMLLSTRNHGLPKKEHPVMSDFNYIVAKTNIDGKDYLLDATDKMLTFGTLPFRCLNHYGRVMDFRKESYWHTILPSKQNIHSIRGQMNFNLEDNIASGTLNDISLGYEGLGQKRKWLALNKEEYLANVEEQFGPDFFIKDYSINDQLDEGNRLYQQFQFEIEDFVGDNTIYFNPFIRKFFSTNPFKAEQRFYPIDFGYPRQYVFALSVMVPEGYKIKSLPEKVGLKLPENSGSLIFDCKQEEGRVSLFFQFKINGTQFVGDSYSMVKSIFGKAVEVQNQSLVVFEKI